MEPRVWPPRLFSARHLVTLHRGERGDSEEQETPRFLSAQKIGSNTHKPTFQTGFCLCPSHNGTNSDLWGTLFFLKTHPIASLYGRKIQSEVRKLRKILPKWQAVNMPGLEPSTVQLGTAPTAQFRLLAPSSEQLRQFSVILQRPLHCRIPTPNLHCAPPS